MPWQAAMFNVKEPFSKLRQFKGFSDETPIALSLIFDPIGTTRGVGVGRGLYVHSSVTLGVNGLSMECQHALILE